jgi:hypothetical protein
MGVAAYKTVELDDSLGGAPVQHREVQEHESPQFLALFKKGIKYLDGGVESGFKHVDREAFEKRMLHIKGRRNVRVSQVPVASSSLNRGDVFVFDLGLTIFQWNGAQCSRAERQAGLDYTRRIRDEERGGKARIVVIDDGVDDDTEFFKELGGKAGIRSAEEGGDDDKFERSRLENLKLYLVSDASGSMTVRSCPGTRVTNVHVCRGSRTHSFSLAGQGSRC